MPHYIVRAVRQWLSSDDLPRRLSHRSTILSRSNLSCHLRHRGACHSSWILLQGPGGATTRALRLPDN